MMVFFIKSHLFLANFTYICFANIRKIPKAFQVQEEQIKWKIKLIQQSV